MNGTWHEQRFFPTQFVRRLFTWSWTDGSGHSHRYGATLSHRPWRMTQWSTLTLRATLSGSISPHARAQVYVRGGMNVCEQFLYVHRCTRMQNAAKVEVLSPGSQVPRCTPIAKSSPLWELHSECILHPVPRFGLIHRKTRRIYFATEWSVKIF